MSGRAPIASDDDGGARAAIERALAARDRLIASATNERLARALAAAARAWRDGGEHRDGRTGARRASVIALSAEQSRLHPGLVGYGLDLAFSAIDESAIAGLIAEAEPAAALERAVERPGGHANSGRARLLGPAVVFHCLAGNVTGLALPAIVAGVLARSVTVIRDSARQPALTEAFAATLADIDADVAALVVPLWWPAGDVTRERDVLALVERAELWGSSATIEAVRNRHAPLRDSSVETIERGTRWSAGLIPADVEEVEQWAEAFALDVVLHDGLGCLTPDAIFVAGGRERALAFATALADALAVLEKRWPRRPREFDVEARRRGFVDRCEALALAGGELLRGPHDAWVVACGGHWDAVSGPGLRCVRVIACDTDGDALGALARPPAPLAAVGLATSRSDPQGAPLARRLTALGATLVCAPGRMQAPPLTWAQDGRRRLGDLLAWRAEKAGIVPGERR